MRGHVVPLLLLLAIVPAALAGEESPAARRLLQATPPTICQNSGAGSSPLLIDEQCLDPDFEEIAGRCYEKCSSFNGNLQLIKYQGQADPEDDCLPKCSGLGVFKVSNTATSITCGKCPVGYRYDVTSGKCGGPCPLGYPFLYITATESVCSTKCPLHFVPIDATSCRHVRFGTVVSRGAMPRPTANLVTESASSSPRGVLDTGCPQGTISSGNGDCLKCKNDLFSEVSPNNYICAGSCSNVVLSGQGPPGECGVSAYQRCCWDAAVHGDIASLFNDDAQQCVDSLATFDACIPECVFDNP